MLNTVALPAIARASEKIAKRVTRRPFLKVRIAKRKSWKNAPTVHPLGSDRPPTRSASAAVQYHFP